MGTHARIQSLFDALDDEEKKLRHKLDMHERRAEVLRKKLKEADERFRDLVVLSERRAKSVTDRWNLRRMIRDLNSGVLQIERFGAPGRAGRIRQMVRTRIDEIEDKLRKHAVDIPSGVGGCGVYALYDGDELVYIGQSINVLQRVGQHAASKIFTHASFISVPERLLNDVERALINTFTPRMNTDPATRLARIRNAQ